MFKTIHKTMDGHYETEHSSLKLNFLDCNCQCYGHKQKYIPNKKYFSDQQFYLNVIKMLVKSHYALDCTCQCGYNQKQRTSFSTDTGIIEFDKFKTAY